MNLLHFATRVDRHDTTTKNKNQAILKTFLNFFEIFFIGNKTCHLQVPTYVFACLYFYLLFWSLALHYICVRDYASARAHI